MANTYDTGDLVRVTATFTDADSSAYDPTTVTFKYKDPSGNVTTLTYGTDDEVVKSSTGVYYVDVSVDEHGDWWYRWAGSGTGQAADEDYFTTTASRF